jgi:hypothetical protein
MYYKRKLSKKGGFDLHFTTLVSFGRHRWRRKRDNRKGEWVNNIEKNLNLKTNNSCRVNLKYLSHTKRGVCVIYVLTSLIMVIMTQCMYVYKIICTTYEVIYADVNAHFEHKNVALGMYSKEYTHIWFQNIYF